MKTSTDSASDVEVWLESLDPAAVKWRDADHFRRILAAREAVEAAESDLRDAVVEARAAGDPWSMIGFALGTSKQAAHERFGPSTR